MRSYSDVLSRWPRLQVADRHARLHGTLQLTPGRLAVPAHELLAGAREAGTRLWKKDAALWSAVPDEQRRIADRLGWLDAPGLMADAIERLTAFAERARADGFTDAVLLGMGGSSLAPEVLRAILGTRPGWLRLHVLDSTDPASILAVDTVAARTLVLVASKSGTTIEPVSLALHFRERLTRAGIAHWARQFVAITDEGTELAAQARSDGFRDTFLNPSDIGGRYSALSFFGLVPAALMGHDLAALVGWGLAELADTMPGGPPISDGRAVTLGAVLAAGALAGRDKATLLVPARYEPLGLWVEQLVAESTGKRGSGILPIAGEPLRRPADYSDDRMFVHMRACDDPSDSLDALTQALRTSDQPLVTMTLPEPEALGAEFVRWEIATAVAAALLGINPFDEPNVAQAKEATGRLLGEFKTQGRLPLRTPDIVLDHAVALRLSAAVAGERQDRAVNLPALFRPGDYFALLAYLGPDAALADALHAFRAEVGARTGCATTFGYGPRYLHSTGQLHKGGPNTGVFVLVSADPARDVTIPDREWTFGTLELAQALGDFASLDALGRRALHVHLPRPDPALVASAAAAVMSRASAAAR